MKSEQMPPGRRALAAVRALVFALAALPLACSGGKFEVPEHAINLMPLLGADALSAGVVDVRSAAGMAALESGWHKEGNPEDGGVWASSLQSSLLIASLAGEQTTLDLELGAPGFLPYEFTVDVFLNGESLGQLKPVASVGSLTMQVPSGLTRVGINRLELRSSHVASPSEFGSNPDTRQLGLRFRSARFNSPSEGTGQFVRFRIPSAGKVSARFNGSGTVVVQDAQTLDPVSSMSGSDLVEVDLAPEEGREVFVSAWGDLAGLEMIGRWNPTNVILIISDTLRNDALAFVPTPTLDALGSEGTRFGQSFTHAPMTLPSHTALFSSRYPHISGVVNNGQEVPQDLPLLADWLTRSGYQTRAVASLGTLWLGRPDVSLDRGFQSFQHARGDDSTGAETEPLLEQVLDELSPDSPFFLFAHFADPHEPYRDTVSEAARGTVSIDGEVVAEFNAREGPHVDVRRELSAGEHRVVIDCPDTLIKVRSLHVWTGGPWGKWVNRELVDGDLMEPTNRLESTFNLGSNETIDLQVWLADKPKRSEIPTRYAYEVERVDQAVGKLIGSLKARGLWDSSLVIFTADHGEALGEHGSIGHVQTLFDELVHVPLFIKAPIGPQFDGLQEKFAQREDRLVRHIDLVPTILDVIDQPPLPGQMGHSILDEDFKAVLLTETHAPEAKQDLYAFRDERFKLIFAPKTDTFEMFDCIADPLELTDVFATLGKERAEWQALLRSMAERWESGEQATVDEGELDRLKAMGYL